MRDATGATSTHITASWLHTAPETFANERDERSDLYSLASTAYTLISGHAPFWRSGEDSLNPLMYRLVNVPPPPLAPDLVPPELNAFLMSALAKDPAARPQTAEDFVAALVQIRSAAAAPGGGGLGPSGSPTEVASPAVGRLSEPPNTTVVAPEGVLPGSGDDATIADTVVGSASTSAADNPSPETIGLDSPDSTQPPSGPPPDGPVGDRAADGDGRNWWKVALPVAVVFAVIVTAVAFMAGTDSAGASELVLEPIASFGQDPFTAPLVPGADGGPDPEPPDGAGEIIEALNPIIGELPATDFSRVTLPSDPDGTISVAGSASGLYGGTNEIEVCDRDALIEFLTSDPSKGGAWADVHGISRDEIPSYVGGLTDVVLQVDTRVTNHGFGDGSAIPIDSVLQAGTAVLIDEFGVPRVRCYCGNPLLEPRPLATDEPSIIGTSWDGFDLDEVVIVAAVDPVTELVLDDLVSDAVLTRQPGADLDQDNTTTDTTATSTTSETQPSDAVPFANGFTAIDTTSPPCTAGQDGPAIPTEWTIPFTYTFAADGSVTMEGEVVCEPGVEPTIFHSEGSGTWVPSTGSFALSMLVTFGGDSSSLDVTGTVDPEAGTITLDGETSAVRIIPIDD